MYKVIGADGREYGPVSADQMKQWIAEGRVNSQTQVGTEGAADWQPISTLPEFAAEVTRSAGPPAVPLPTPASKRSGLAVGSLVLGILGLFTFGATAIVGLVLGIVAMVKINNSQGRLSGQGLAIAGTVVSGFFLLMLPIYAALLLPALAQAKQRAQSINCMSNVRQLSLAVMMYSSDNNDLLPRTNSWCDQITQYVRSADPFRCPTGEGSLRSHYAFNAKLSGLSQIKISRRANTVMLFETEGGWNASGGPELMLKSPRHGKQFIVAFTDGHVEQINEARLQNLRWDP